MNNDRRLCDRCAYGMIMRGNKPGEEEVICTSVFRLITFDVTECNRFAQRDAAPVTVESVQNKWVM